MKNKALDLVYNTHTEGKEKIVFLKEYLLKHDDSKFYDNMYDTLEFFYKHIPLHFAYEEVVINALLKRKVLTKDEVSNMNRILEEHKVLKTNFEKLKEMAAKMDKGNKEQREDFVEIVNDTVCGLIKHAEFEDEHLFPVADIKTDDSLLSSIEKEMSRIVY